MTQACQNNEFHASGYQNYRRAMDMDLVSFGVIEDPFNENEFRNNYKHFTANPNTSVIASKISSDLLTDSPHRPKFSFSKKKNSSKKHHDVTDEPSTDKKHSKTNEVTSIVSNIFNFGKGRNRSNSVSNDKQPLGIIKKSSSNDSSDNKIKPNLNSFENEAEHHKRKKIVTFFRDGKNKAENTRSIQKQAINSNAYLIPTSNNSIINQYEQKRIDVRSILKNELVDLQKRKRPDTLYINVTSNSIDSFFIGANNQIGRIFEYKNDIDLIGIENSKKALKQQIKSKTELLSLTSQKVNGLYTRLDQLKNVMNDTTENINQTHQKVDFLHEKIQNLVDDFGIVLNDSIIEIDESWFDENDSCGNQSIEDKAYQSKQQSFLSIFSFIYYCFISFIQLGIDSLKGINLSRFETSSKKKKSKKGFKKRKVKSKNINKMIKIVKVDSPDQSLP